MYTKEQLDKREMKKKLLNDLYESTFDGKAMKGWRNRKKADLVEEFLNKQSELNKTNEDIDSVDVDAYTAYHVRYIGYQSQIEHGPQSTPSGTPYKFPKNQWVEVHKADFAQKYYEQMKRALRNKESPHWECAVTTVKGDFTILHNEIIKKLGNKRIKYLDDFTGITEFHISRMGNAGIRSLRDFQNIPDEWFIRNLSINNVMLAHWKDEALKGIEQDRKEVSALLESYKGD